MRARMVGDVFEEEKVSGASRLLQCCKYDGSLLERAYLLSVML
jgi:hypothetical protein